jgi:hypothetical protein
MRKSFAPIDDLLIEHVFQPISDMFTHRLGRSRAAAACFCVDLASLGWILSRTPGLNAAVADWNAGVAALDLGVLLIGLMGLIALRILFRKAATKAAGNPLRLSMRPHRAIILLMLAARLAELTATDFGSFADLAMLVCAASALYLGACAERPPVRRRSPALAEQPA